MIRELWLPRRQECANFTHPLARIIVEANPRGLIGRCLLGVLGIIASMLVFCPQAAKAADPDLQLWFPVQFIHPVGEK